MLFRDHELGHQSSVAIRCGLGELERGVLDLGDGIRDDLLDCLRPALLIQADALDPSAARGERARRVGPRDRAGSRHVDQRQLFKSALASVFSDACTCGSTEGVIHASDAAGEFDTKQRDLCSANLVIELSLLGLARYWKHGEAVHTALRVARSSDQNCNSRA